MPALFPLALPCEYDKTVLGARPKHNVGVFFGSPFLSELHAVPILHSTISKVGGLL